MRFELLGPFRVYHDGRSVPLGSVKQRLLLATLLLRPNEVVGTDELTAMLWGDEEPPSAAANLRTYVRGLRRSLGGGTTWDGITAAAGGYLLRVGPGERDLDLFDAAATRGREALAASDLDRAEAELSAAVRLWRGAPLSDLPLRSTLARRVAQLEERRLLVEEDYAEAVLALGASADVVHRLRGLLDRHPLRQRAWGQLMVGLYRIGDVAGALDAFQQARQTLAEETGLDPAPELVTLYDDILHHRPGLAAQPPTAPDRPAPETEVGPPFNAPSNCRVRCRSSSDARVELASLDGLLNGGAQWPTSVAISVVSGMAGVGKTALAVHWAHRVADRFPDGQLYVNLRGFDQAGAVSPADALRGFLDALGVPPARIPADLDAQAGLYRSLLAGRRMLVVLDNARDAAQVRAAAARRGPLRGGGDQPRPAHRPDRRRGRHPLTLDLLTGRGGSGAAGPTARGRAGVAAEPAAVADIIGPRGRLPLALSIVAARVATHPTFPLSAIAAELRLGRGEAGRVGRRRRPACLFVVVPGPRLRTRPGCSPCWGCIRART